MFFFSSSIRILFFYQFVHPRPEIRRSAANLYPLLFYRPTSSAEVNGEDMDEKQLHEEREEALILFKWLHRDVAATAEERAMDNLLAKMPPNLYTVLYTSVRSIKFAFICIKVISCKSESTISHCPCGAKL